MTPTRSLRTAGALAVLVAAGAAAFSLWRGSGTSDEGRPIEVRSGGLRLEATFDPDPPQAGRNSIELRARDDAGGPVESAEVRATATMPAMGTMPEMRAPAEVEELGDGRYRLSLELPMGGSWPLALHVHAPGRGRAEAHFRFKTGIPVALEEAREAGDRGEAAEAAAYYTCSMHPSVRSSTPGQCPICSMDLVPVTRREVDTGVIRVDGTRRQVIGVETGRAERKAVSARIRGVGSVLYDETRLTDVTLKVRGWIDEISPGRRGSPSREASRCSRFTLRSSSPHRRSCSRRCDVRAEGNRRCSRPRGGGSGSGT